MADALSGAMALARKTSEWSRALLVAGLLGILVVAIDRSMGDFPPAVVREFADVDTQLSRVRGRMAFLAHVNPLPESVIRERRRFFSARSRGEIYNPQFEYPPIAFPSGEMTADLTRLSVPRGSLSGIYRQLQLELTQRLQCLAVRGTADFGSCAEALYGRPSPQLVDRARTLLVSLPPAKVYTEPALDAQDVAALLTAQLEAERLIGWSVLPRERIVARAAVVSSRRTVFVRPAQEASLREVARLQVHEIGTHVRRAVAGERYGLRIFARGLPGYLATEEGLAIVREEQAKILGAGQLRRYAGRVLAADLARTASFARVFETLAEYGLPEQEAFEITLRVKRGLSDTSAPGAFTKDYLYLHGKFLVTDYLARGGSLEELLHAGKVGIEHLDLLPLDPRS